MSMAESVDPMLVDVFAVEDSKGRNGWGFELGNSY
jgi:hypothetical protein